jgi:hypothetical protein
LKGNISALLFDRPRTGKQVNNNVTDSEAKMYRPMTHLLNRELPGKRRKMFKIALVPALDFGQIGGNFGVHESAI